MATTKNPGLQIIFSFFLGLMITAFIGVGVWTFYPSPSKQIQDQIEKLDRERQQLYGYGKSETDLSSSDQRRAKEIDDKVNALYDKQKREEEPWGRNTSIILVTFATVIMAISLIRADQLRVISNGLLLGGVFTMLYGTGWSIATGTSYVRFGVMAAALLITIGLGYARFVRDKQVPAKATVAGATGGAVTDAGLTELSARVDSLEAKLKAVAQAFKAED